ncbi:hypothetical protein K435DRAFT_860416 [Dendrothele bispora CBS 962.96]|uniref:Uncharacterized protein n=1 Tax=Dendrothele bispora (strain CBS 962.96) TaxID=1314807 RepID=A0A4S8LZ66_DENBC|nr:hypothetical protein K435DRAFT_860416 [Dendrothele bispora CBS 962.96]
MALPNRTKPKYAIVSRDEDAVIPSSSLLLMVLTFIRSISSLSHHASLKVPSSRLTLLSDRNAVTSRSCLSSTPVTNSSPTQPTSAQIAHSTAETSPTHLTGGDETWAPGLERVNKPLSPDKIQQEMKSRRFNIAVDSVWYYLALRGETRCAVLLTTNLDLRDSDKFAFAKVPFVATSHPDSGTESASTNTERSVGFFEHFPSDAEYLKVRKVSGTKDTFVKPSFEVEALGVRGAFSGVGTEKHQNIDQSYHISLKSTWADIANAPRHIEWTYEDQHGVFYPRTIRLLVIVNKANHSGTFPFDLILKKDLIVELHGIWDAVSRLVAKPMNHEGWRFRIKGNYKKELARAALDEARKTESSGISHPTSYGLHAGAKSWIMAQTTAEGFVPQSANRPPEESMNESQSSAS